MAVAVLTRHAVAGVVGLLGSGAAQAHPRTGRRAAPPHLSVDDRSNPLAISGTPWFGWHPQDRDGDQTQTAYQIVVTRDRGVVVELRPQQGTTAGIQLG